MAKKKKTVKRKNPANPWIDWFPEAGKSTKTGEFTQVESVQIDEALSVSARRKLAQRMIKMARKMTVARKKARGRFATPSNLKLRAQKLGRSIFRKRLAGARGENYKTLGMADKMAVDKLIDKQKKPIKQLVKRLMPAVKRAEGVRLNKVVLGSDNVQDKRHKAKFGGPSRK